MKKLILAVLFSIFFTVWIEAKQIIDTVETAQTLCEDNKWVYDNDLDICTINNNTISGTVLFGAYKEASENKMYLWGSKYFDERTGSYNKILQQSDYKGLVFIKANISTIYKQYSKEINSKVSSLSHALGYNKTVTYQESYEKLLWKSLIKRLDIFVIKVLNKTNKMQESKRKPFLIKTVQFLDKIKIKYTKKRSNKKNKKIINMLEYLNYKIEKHISYTPANI